MTRRIVLNESVFHDKVLGCWLGKNAGGTLGEPLEERFGRAEMFDISWYPQLREGGTPNDDLEMQLIWLQALQEKGPAITSEDLAQSWLDCVVYNFDEYGLSKANLQRGLRPPVSGWHNNWFKDCMGSPIRSEIWACVAPAAPEIAARYAYHDAICDHAGGESVYGEVFNAVVESCAFVESDPARLIQIGLSAIPAGSLTHRAIARVVSLHDKSVDWKEARETIRKEFFHPVAQYSPINLAYQTIGWLYGKDFGDALCKAVNCGWDTDCTAATLGAILGIIRGAKRLPKKWTEPLGDQISTNLSTGGIRNLKAPTDIHVLTDQVCAMARRVLGFWDVGVTISTSGRDLTAGASLPLAPDWLADKEPNALDHDLGSVLVSVRYDHTAAIVGNEPTPLTIRISNPHPVAVQGMARIAMPDGFSFTPSEPVTFALDPVSDMSISCRVSAPAAAIADSQAGLLTLSIVERPVPQSVPLVLLGGSRWMASDVLPGKSLEDAFEPGSSTGVDKPPAGYSELWRTGNDLQAESLFQGRKGIVHLVHHVLSDVERQVVIGVPNSSRMMIHLEGKLLHRTTSIVPIRPNLGNSTARGDSSNYVKTVLRKGWNRFLVSLERGEGPIEAHFVIGGVHERYTKCDGLPVIGLVRSRFSWEQPSA
jgi:ADP-ribosylglycohydrolase